MEQRQALDTLPKYRFSLTYQRLAPAEADALQSFFAARGGSLESFNFVSPRDGQNYVVRYAEPRAVRVWFEHVWERMQVELIQVANETPDP